MSSDASPALGTSNARPVHIDRCTPAATPAWYDSWEMRIALHTHTHTHTRTHARTRPRARAPLSHTNHGELFLSLLSLAFSLELALWCTHAPTHPRTNSSLTRTRTRTHTHTYAHAQQRTILRILQASSAPSCQVYIRMLNSCQPHRAPRVLRPSASDPITGAPQQPCRLLQFRLTMCRAVRASREREQSALHARRGRRLGVCVDADAASITSFV